MAVTDLVAIYDRVLPMTHAGLLAGMVFGVKTAVPTELYDDMVTTGTVHMLALSGMNITILTNVCMALLIRMTHRALACVITLFLTIGFISLVGPSPSVVRAGIMGSLNLVAVIAGRRSWSVASLGLAVAGMLLLNPLWLLDVGFQLSVLATAGILLFGMPGQSDSATDPQQPRSPIQYFLYGIGNIVKDDLRVTLAAQVFTIPVIVFAFHRISLVAPLSNVLVGWIIPPVTVLGLAMAGVGLGIPQLAVPIGWVLWIFLTYMVKVIDLTARLPLASIGW